MAGYSRRDFVQFAGAAFLGGPAALAATRASRPYLQSLTRTSATVVWTTFDPSPARLEYALDPGPSQFATARTRHFTPAQTGLPQSLWLHQARLTGLTPRTRYRYRVSPSDDFAQFATPGSGRSRIVIFGDSGAETDAQRQLAVRMTARHPDLILHTGDLVYPVGDADSYLRKYFGLYQDLFAAAPAFPCPGNHDYYHAGGQMFVEFNQVPRESVPPEGHGRYYSFDWENAHLTVLDSNTPLEEAAAGRGPMLEWLEQDLAATHQYWRIVMFHHPPYAGGPNQGDPLSELVRRHIVPILERHHVDLVFCGHEHSYQRTHPVGGIVYFTTGGGGAEIYPPVPRAEAAVQRGRHHFLEAQLDATSFAVRAIGTDGHSFDSFVLQPPPRLLNRVTSAACDALAVAPGGLATVMGRSLSPVEVRGDSPGLRVSLDSQPVTILYANAEQINFRVPPGLSGAVRLRVETANGTVEQRLELAPTAPAIFPGLLFHEDGRPLNAESPARLGQRVTLYFTGRGTGAAISARLGSLEIDVVAQPVPASPGVERADLTLSQPGALTLWIDGVASNSVLVPLAQ